MKLIPALSVMNERAVKARDGDYYYLRDDNNEHWHIDDILYGLKEKYEEAYIMDIDGIERNQPNLKLIQSTMKILPLWLDAAPISPLGVMDLLVAGAGKVVVSTRAMRSLDHLREALKMSEDIILSIDYDGAIISPNPKIASLPITELVRQAEEAGCKDMIFFQFCRLSRGAKLETSIIKDMIYRLQNVYVAGIIEQNDLAEIEQTGAFGAIRP